MPKKKTASLVPPDHEARDEYSNVDSATEAVKEGKPPRPRIQATDIRLRGGRMHNLKNIDIDIPLGKLVVICGVSGSGKTSLALDTLYAEGQRRYIESFSPYTRQFLQRLDKPEYDSLENMPAAIAVKRGAMPRSNRSTVSTTAEIDDYLRILMARIAQLFCPGCGQRIERHTPPLIVQWVTQQPKAKAMIGFQLSWVDANDLASQLATLQSGGFTRVILDGRMYSLADGDRTEMANSAKLVRTGFVVVDRIVTGEPSNRLNESIETAYEWGQDSLYVLVEILESENSTNPPEIKPSITSNVPAVDLQLIQVDGRLFKLNRFSRDLTCFTCNRTFASPEPRTFSFNSSLGACPTCEGLGEVSELDFDKLVPDKQKTLRMGAIAPWNSPSYEHEKLELLDLAEDYGIPVDVPYSKLNEKAIRLITHGVPERNFGGLDGFFQWLDRHKYKMHVRIFAARWRSYRTCGTCLGRRLNPDALGYRMDGKSIDDLSRMQIDEMSTWIHRLDLDATQKKIAADSLSQLKNRLRFLQQVGLGYLTLDRPLRTLSGGEATRVTLTTSLGSDLVSMLYVLDEPTVGLHPADTSQLVDAIENLRHRGNTVLVIEHEPSLIKKANHLIEIGPQAGRRGGKVCFSGSLDALRNADSLTGKYLFSPTGKSRITPNESDPASNKRTVDWNRSVFLSGASGRNLKSIDVRFPLGCLCLVTGVSGSGKSSLVLDTLAAAIQLNSSQSKKSIAPLPFQSLEGAELVGDCVIVDQDPIGASPRSNPATYTRVFDEIRNIFADTRDAKAKGITKDGFSFNNQDGQCPRCEGDGILSIDMQFLADIQTPCPECHGTRYRQAILEVKYRDRSIADCLNMAIDEAKEFFRGVPKVQQRLQSLIDVGLGYLQLGQSAPTLSSGESQRLKLASYLNDTAVSNSLFIMDEPTTGLHFHDIDRLIGCLNRLIDAGHSVIVIEHNEQLIRAADYVIDLGPGAAEKGGTVVACGTVPEIINHAQSITGKFLKRED